MKKKKSSSVGQELLGRLERFTSQLDEIEELGERFTCRTVKLDLKPKAYTAAMVKKTRQSLRASQAIFATFLGVSLSAVRDWEQGLKPPSGAACRLMDEIRQNPAYFLQRLKDLATPAESGK